jgi:hypothetical protein
MRDWGRCEHASCPASPAGRRAGQGTARGWAVSRQQVRASVEGWRATAQRVLSPPGGPTNALAAPPHCRRTTQPRRNARSGGRGAGVAKPQIAPARDSGGPAGPPAPPPDAAGGCSQRGANHGGPARLHAGENRHHAAARPLVHGEPRWPHGRGAPRHSNPRAPSPATNLQARKTCPQKSTPTRPGECVPLASARRPPWR